MNVSLLRVCLFALALSAIAAHALVTEDTETIRIAAVLFPGAHDEAAPLR